METNRPYRRHVSTARFGFSSHCAAAQSLLNALSDCKGNLIYYRVLSLKYCLYQCFPKCFSPSIFSFLDAGNISDLFEQPSYVGDINHLLSCLKICNISAIEFYSNGDLKVHFYPFKYKCS